MVGGRRYSVRQGNAKIANTKATAAKEAKRETPATIPKTATTKNSVAAKMPTNQASNKPKRG